MYSLTQYFAEAGLDSVELCCDITHVSVEYERRHSSSPFPLDTARNPSATCPLIADHAISVKAGDTWMANVVHGVMGAAHHLTPYVRQAWTGLPPSKMSIHLGVMRLQSSKSSKVSLTIMQTKPDVMT